PDSWLEPHTDADGELREREGLDVKYFPEAVSHVHVGPAGGDPDAGDELCHRPERALFTSIDDAIWSAEHNQQGIAHVAKRALVNRAFKVENARSAAHIRSE